MLRNLHQVSAPPLFCRAATLGPQCAPGDMNEAFELCRLVEKLPLKICAIATWGELPSPGRARGN